MFILEVCLCPSYLVLFLLGVPFCTLLDIGDGLLKATLLGCMILKMKDLDKGIEKKNAWGVPYLLMFSHFLIVQFSLNHLLWSSLFVSGAVLES